MIKPKKDFTILILLFRVNLLIRSQSQNRTSCLWAAMLSKGSKCGGKDKSVYYGRPFNSIQAIGNSKLTWKGDSVNYFA